MCHGTEQTNNESGVIGNGGIWDVNHTVMFNGIGEQPFNEDAMTNVLCAAKLKDAGFDIHWNTKKVDAMFVESPHDDSVRKFQCSDDGLHFHGLWDDKLISTKDEFNELMVEQTFMSSQKENSEWCTKGR